MHGKALAILQRAGANVTKGERVAIVEAMKMEHALLAPADGIASEISAQVGAQVAEGAQIRTIESKRRIMPLHLIKLCVGLRFCRGPQDWIKEQFEKKKKSGEAGKRFHRTRMVPKRGGNQLLDGGSLFWVIKGEVLCRERTSGIEPFTDKDGIGRCRIVLDGKPKLVQPRPYRAFQGWRYLPPKDAPPDLYFVAPGVRHMPEQMRRELRELGLL